MVVDPGIVLAFASGAPLAALGVLLLLLRPWRRQQLVFGLFAVVWGIEIAVANLGRLLQADPVIHRAALLVSYGLVLVAALLLIRFVSTRLGDRSRTVLVGAFAGLALVGGVALAVRPDWFVAAVGGSGPTTLVLGPAVLPLVLAPFHGAFYASVAILYRAHRDADPGTERRRERTLLLAMALFPSYVSASLLVAFSSPSTPVVFQSPGGTLGPVLLFAAGVVTLVGIALHAALDPPRPGGRDLLLVGAIVGPMTVAVAEAGLGRIGLTIDTLGAWRIATVAILVYALVRHRLFDLDVRLKAVAGPGIAALAIGVGALVSLTRAAAGGSLVETVFPLTLAAAVGGAAWNFGDRLGEALFPGIEREPPYLDRRRFEVYRGHLEEALAADSVDETELARLRDRLGVTEREDAVMRYLLTKQLPDRAEDDLRVEPGATIAGRYRVRHRLGEGAHGRVHLAYDEETERQVVVKVVGTMVYGGKAADLLLREARIVAGIDHPNVVEVLDVLEGRHEVAQVMAYAEGGSLRGLLDRRGSSGPRRAVEIVDQVLAGLGAAHAEGVVHRDVKPENLLLTDDGRVTVADFGVAYEAGRDATGLTGGAIGTLLYMSPEQLRGGEVGPASDLYAVGVVLHELLTGRYYLPLAGRDDFQVRRAILEETPELDLEGRASSLRPVLERALAKDPKDRYASADEMREALAAR